MIVANGSGKGFIAHCDHPDCEKVILAVVTLYSEAIAAISDRGWIVSQGDPFQDKTWCSFHCMAMSRSPKSGLPRMK